MNLLGMHSFKKEEEKARMQREYRQQLDMQIVKPVSEESQRRREISDQVFNELVKPPIYYQQPTAMPQAIDAKVVQNEKPAEFFKH
jgi:hypothetical protein